MTTTSPGNQELSSESALITATRFGSLLSTLPMFWLAHDWISNAAPARRARRVICGTESPRRLTVKLRGRTTTPERRRGRTLSPATRGAKPHGPLQRLLGGRRTPLLNRSHLKYRVGMIVRDMGM